MDTVLVLLVSLLIGLLVVLLFLQAAELREVRRLLRAERDRNRADYLVEVK